MTFIKRENDEGFKNLLKVFGQNQSMEIGVFADAKAKKAISGDNSDYLALRYRWNDEGTGRIPKRETLRPSILKTMESDSVIKGIFNHLDKRGVRGKMDDLDKIGVRLRDGVKKGILDLKQPPKSQKTIDSYLLRFGKKRDNPLIRTGDMRQAVEHRFVK